MSARKQRGGSNEFSPFRVFDMGELAQMMGVTANWMTAAKKAGAPFSLGKSRPEWILKFLADHPNLQLKEFECGRPEFTLGLSVGRLVT